MFTNEVCWGDWKADKDIDRRVNAGNSVNGGLNAFVDNKKSNGTKDNGVIKLIRINPYGPTRNFNR